MIEDLERELMIIVTRQSMADRVRDHVQLDRSAYLLLSRIQQDGPRTIGQLAEAFGLDVSTVNRQTKAMLKSGLVDRVPDAEGGMARKFTITQLGERRLGEDRAVRLGLIGTVLADWTPEEIDAAVAVLTKLNLAAETYLGVTPWPRPNLERTL